MILRSSGFGRVEKYEKCQSFDADGGGGRGGEEGTWKVLRNVIYCLLPPYSAFCISYVTQLSNIFPMRRRHGIILKGQCSLDKCFRNNFHDILLQKFTRVFHILALKESSNYSTTICALNSCICTSLLAQIKCGEAKSKKPT